MASVSWRKRASASGEPVRPTSHAIASISLNTSESANTIPS